MAATYREIDAMVREALPDSVERRQILQALHDIEEGQSLCLNYALGACGYRMQADGSFIKGQSTRFQVNAPR